MTIPHLNYTIKQYKAYKLEVFRCLDLDYVKYFNTIGEIAEEIGENISKVHRACYCKQLQQSTGKCYQISRNSKRFEVCVEGVEPVSFGSIKEIAAFTGDYFGLIKGKIQIVE